MYEFFSQISNVLFQPLLNLANSFERIPILFSFFLGLVGTSVPCQLTGNIGAITLYGNKSFQKGIVWLDVFFFTLGKIVAFTGLGLLVWVLGNEIQNELTFFFPWIRKMIGPILILVGMFMIGFLKMKWKISLFEIPSRFFKEGKLGSFVMGVSFSLGFCPTMFILFFMTLMPLVLSSPYGFILPGIFAIGTTLPIFIMILIIWYLDGSGVIMRKGRKFGLLIQRLGGMVIILLGVLDTITYWTI